MNHYVQSSRCLLQLHDYDDILSQWRMALSAMKLATNKTYRYLYARQFKRRFYPFLVIIKPIGLFGMKWALSPAIPYGCTFMSKSKLKSAQYSINELVKNIKGYSFSAKQICAMLNRCIKDLHEQGYKLGHLNGLKPKHIHALVDLWSAQGKSTATIKNYMAKLRKVGVLLHKPQLVKPGNDAYQIKRRSYAPTVNKAIHQTDF